MTFSSGSSELKKVEYVKDVKTARSPEMVYTHDFLDNFIVINFTFTPLPHKRYRNWKETT